MHTIGLVPDCARMHSDCEVLAHQSIGREACLRFGRLDERVVLLPGQVAWARGAKIQKTTSCRFWLVPQLAAG